MQEKKKQKKRRSGKWYEKYLPFIARSRERQIQWLIGAFRKKTLSLQEITPYVKLLLEEDDPEGLVVLRKNLAELDSSFLKDMLRAADIYDTVKILALLPEVSREQAVIALSKEPPPYESAPEQVVDRLFQSVHAADAELLKEVAAMLLQSDRAPAHFEGSYTRFLEILRDQEFLSTLYPRARN